MAIALTPPRKSPLPGTLSDWRKTVAAHYLRLGFGPRQRRFMAALPDRPMRLITDRVSPDVVLGIEAEPRRRRA